MTRKFDFVYTCIHWSHAYGCFDIFKWKSRKGFLIKQKQKHGSLILKYWKKNFPLNTKVFLKKTCRGKNTNFKLPPQSFKNGAF